ncbi:MAG TPA: GNAT family protein [Gammaproteobacteria bacterium]|nr:GNAT family protein [Gammaproteobacteria bacterium]
MSARVFLERPSARRERGFVAAALRSRALHRGLVAAPATPAEYHDYLRRARRGNQVSFFVVDLESRDLAGVVDVNDIERGPLPSGRLGYYAFAPAAGTGLMREGVALVIDCAFRDLGLARLDANIQPGNLRSLEFAAQLGFTRDGTARGYLKIGTRWRDHERWALLARDWHSR